MRLKAEDENEEMKILAGGVMVKAKDSGILVFYSRARMRLFAHIFFASFKNVSTAT